MINLPKFLILMIGLLFFSCSKHADLKPAPTPAITRIISLAPSITETLFALGLGQQVIGVTNFCTYPPAVKALPKVGGYVDPNYEMIVSLKPDLVVLLKEHVAAEAFLKNAGIRCLAIDNHNLSAICSTFITIGRICNRTKAADSIVTAIRTEMVVDDSTTVRPPKVLLCVGRDNVGGKIISSIYAAGPKTFYNDLITAAGGQNVLTSSNLEYPQIAAEGVIQLAPDIIIEMIDPSTTVLVAQAQGDWNNLKGLIKQGTSIAVLKNDYVTIPGPRIVLTLRDFKSIINRKQSK